MSKSSDSWQLKNGFNLLASGNDIVEGWDGAPASAQNVQAEDNRVRQALSEAACYRAIPALYSEGTI